MDNLGKIQVKILEWYNSNIQGFLYGQENMF